MENETGVYYASKDYIGFGRRLLIDLIDFIVVFLVWITILIIAAIIGSSHEAYDKIFFFSILIVSFLYLVVLKFMARTLGYTLLGGQIVSLQGIRPSLPAIILRWVFVFIGPGNVLLDLLWLSGDPYKQAIRDKLARTYVVRRGSQPAGTGTIRYMRLGLFGYQLLYAEVKPISPTFAVAEPAERN